MLRLYLYVKRCLLKTLILGGGAREAKIAQAKKDKANALRKLRRQMEKVVGGNKQ